MADEAQPLEKSVWAEALIVRLEPDISAVLQHLAGRRAHEVPPRDELSAGNDRDGKDSGLIAPAARVRSLDRDALRRLDHRVSGTGCFAPARERGDFRHGHAGR